MLYLHEIIDIVGDGQQDYLDTVGERARHSEAQGISRLVGTWRVVGSTNRWPRVVNLWEMDGWAHWAETLERQFLPAKKDPALAPWWSKAAQWRSGGFDRILEPAAFSPTVAQLKQQGLRSWVCVHTITRTRAGMAARYVKAIEEEALPALQEEGLSLLGVYSVPMRSDEVVSIWSAGDFQRLCQLYATRQQSRALQHWHRRAQTLRQDSETMWIVPWEGCFFHPG